MNFDLIKEKVISLLVQDNTGHGFEHVERVCKTALRLAMQENADVEIVALAALLHDVDDYKLFGAEYAENLTNARTIMREANVSAEKQAQICDIIANMGYNKALKGVRPQTLEGKVVSDADMLDAIGAMGTIRCLAYALARCDTPIFAPNIWPEINLSAEEYKKPNRSSDNFVNHFFEKLLKLKNMMMTEAGYAEAKKRHDFMLFFLRQFFEEQGCSEWIDYLEQYENTSCNIK
ncbi:MAG: HD domain-containing protein [Alphaproteobacteria bacterium]|nr:HD domain-containing protein [Alphaproteobacteria bacterium]